MSDIELKLALAKKLPELIEIHEQGHGLDPKWCFFWNDGKGCQLTDREWCWVVNKLEKSLSTKSDRMNYIIEVGQCVVNPSPVKDHDFDIVTATWQQRAQALHKIGAI